MPLINPGVVAMSPYLADFFYITRRQQVTGTNGRISIVSEAPQLAYGIADVAGPNDLKRLPEGQHAGNVMCFISQTKIQGPTPGYQPDIISWAGTDYLVIDTQPYPRLGVGFYQSLASSQNMIDLLPDRSTLDSDGNVVPEPVDGDCCDG